MPFRWFLLLLAVVAPAPATRRRVDLWVGRDHPFSTLHEAVAAAAAAQTSSDEVVVIHLAPGRHYVGQPLELDRRHDNLVFLGHGTAESPSSISGGRDVPPPGGGGLNLSSAWAVVGPAHCAGCTQVWRAQTPKGVDSRQFYVNGVRANRTWAPFASATNITARGTTPGDPTSDKLLLPGNEMMLMWTHNVSAIELVYRGASSAGSQWQESRCPVTAIGKSPLPLPLPPARVDEGEALRCCASYCEMLSCPICCGVAGGGGSVVKSHTLPCNMSTSQQCPVVCPAAVPFCVGYKVNKKWGGCIKTRPPIHGVELMVAQPCVGNGNMIGGGQQARKVPAYVENVFELLGSAAYGRPGQFFLDSAAGFVYYVPNIGERLESMVGVLPTTEVLIEAKGVHGITYSNIVFEHATWMRPSSPLGFVDVQSGFCSIGPAGGAPLFEGTPAALRFEAAHNVTFRGCTFRHLGSNALSFKLGSQGNLVNRSEFYDLSASAVSIGNRTNPIRPNSADWDLENTVVDSSIHHIAQEYRGAPGILVGFTRGTSLLHNEISQIPYSGISLGWGWDSFPYSYDGANRIDANHIHHHMQILGDGGAIYSLGAQGNMPFAVDAYGRHYKNTTAILQPSTMEGNWIHDAGDAKTAALDHDGIGEGCHCPGGLYTDEGSTNWNMSSNVVERVKWWLNGCRNGCPWIGPDWQDENWYDSSSKNLGFGPSGVANNETKCPTHGNIEVNGSGWPKAARAIMAAAGPRPAAPQKEVSPLLLKADDEVFTMPRWLGMFNEAEPSNISAAAFSAQRPFANLFFHWNVSLLTEIHERFHPNKPGLFLSMQTWGVWHLPALKWRNQNETGLKLHWRDSLNAGLAEAEPHLRSGVLSGIFLGDELGTQGIPFANITSVADVIHKTLVKTGGLSYLNEGTGPFDPQHPRYAGTWGKQIPSSVDLFSIDDYCLLRPDKFDIGWANCSDPAAEAQRVQVFMAEHVKPRMTPHQRLLLVPGLFLDANVSRSGPLAQQEQLMIRKLDAYFDWAKTDHQVVGLNGWHWTTLPDHRTDVQMIPFYWGVDHMKSLQLRLAQIGQLIKAANNTQSSSLARLKTDDGRPWSVDTVSWLVEPASLKLKQSQPSSPLPSSTRVIDLALQRGECESRQIRLRSSMELHQVVVELPTLAGHWTARQVGYVYARSATMYNCSGPDAMNATDDAPCTAGWRPDPLISSSDGVVVPHIPPGTTQPIFITLCVPSAAAAGSAVAQLRVRGRLGATTTASLIADVPVNVEIWPIALPATNDSQSMSTMFGVDAAIWNNPLWRDSTGRGRGPTAAVLRQSWHNFLHQYRLPAGNPYIYEGPLSFDDVTELSVSGAKNINLMYVPLHGAPKKLSYNSSDLARTLDALAPLAATIEASADSSLRRKAVVYGFDEWAQDYNVSIAQMFRAIKQKWPWLRTVSTLNWHNFMPLDFPLDVWINSYTDWDWLLPKKAQLRDAWMAKGKEYWWYWCVGPEQPEFLNTFIERPGIEARMLPWLAALRNVNGLMYYQLNLWASQCADPEGHAGPGQPVTRSCAPVRRLNGSAHVDFDPATFVSGTRFGNGEGSFTYPDEHGMPMSSLRLEAIRDGVEDWELFRQLRAASNDSVARSFITQLVRDGSPGGHSLDTILLEGARRGAARALIALRAVDRSP